MSNIWLDGMMGLVVGDALGLPVQFMYQEEIAERPEGPVKGMEGYQCFDVPAGSWSDDSSLALATLDSISRLNKIDARDIADNFVKWRIDGEFTPFGFAYDIGCTCDGAILTYRKFGDTKTCGKTGERANGNGAIMRILPVCLYWASMQLNTKEDITAEAVASVEEISALTHNHKRSRIACGLYYFMVKAVIAGNDSLINRLQRGLDEGFDFYHKDISALTQLPFFARIMDLSEFAKFEADEINSSGYVIETFEAALWGLITSSSYEECELKVVNLGDDTDSCAAVAGGLAGLYYGYDNIPKDWLAVIARREWIEGQLRKD